MASFTIVFKINYWLINYKFDRIFILHIYLLITSNLDLTIVIDLPLRLRIYPIEWLHKHS